MTGRAGDFASPAPALEGPFQWLLPGLHLCDGHHWTKQHWGISESCRWLSIPPAWGCSCSSRPVPHGRSTGSTGLGWSLFPGASGKSFQALGSTQAQRSSRSPGPPKTPCWAQGEPPRLRRDGAGQGGLRSSHGSSRTQRTAGDAATPGSCTTGCRGSAGTRGRGLAVTTAPSICSTSQPLCSCARAARDTNLGSPAASGGVGDSGEAKRLGRMGSRGNRAWQPLSPRALSLEVARHLAELRPGGASTGKFGPLGICRLLRYTNREMIVWEVPGSREGRDCFAQRLHQPERAPHVGIPPGSWASDLHDYSA